MAMQNVSMNGRYLSYFSDEIKNDKEIAIIAVKNDYRSIKFVSDRLKSEKEIVFLALENAATERVDRESLSFSQTQKYNERKERFQYVLSIVGEKFITALTEDRDSVIKLIRISFPLELLPKTVLKEHRNDWEMNFEAISFSYNWRKFVDEKLLVNRSFWTSFIDYVFKHRFAGNDPLIFEFKFLFLAFFTHPLTLSLFKKDEERRERLEPHLKSPFDIPAWKIRFRFDRETVLELQKHYDNLLRFFGRGNHSVFDVDISNDREFVLNSVRKNGLLLEFASDELRNDEEIVVESLKQNPSALCFLGASVLEKQHDLFHRFVKTREDIITIKDIWKKDMRIFLLVMKHPVLQGDEKFFKEECKGEMDFEEFAGTLTDGEKKEMVSKVARVVVQQYGGNIRYIDDEGFRSEISDDREMMLKAVQEDGLVLEYVSKRLRNDTEFTLEAIRNNWEAIRFCGEAVRNDPEIAIEAIRSNGNAIDYCGEAVRNDEAAILELFKAGYFGIEDVGERLIQRSLFLTTLKGKIETEKKEYQFGSLEELLKAVLSEYYSQTRSDNETPGEEEEEEEFDEKLIGHILKNWLRSHSGKLTDFGVEELVEGEEYSIGKSKKILSCVTFAKLKIFRLLGRGAYAATYLCYSQDMSDFFVVKIYKDPFISEEKKKELIKKDCVDLPYHPNVVSILFHRDDEVVDVTKLPDYQEYWKERFGGRRKEIHGAGIILMKYHGLTLHMFCEKRRRDKFGNYLGIDELFRIMSGILKGVSHLHKNMIVHRDLHLDNIFVECFRGRVWIGDFGCALDLRKNETEFIVPRNMQYMYSLTSEGIDREFKGGGASVMIPPEIKLAEKLRLSTLDYEFCDLYSVGVVGNVILNYSKTTREIEFDEVGPSLDYRDLRAENQNRQFLSTLFEQLTRKNPKERGTYENAVNSILESYGSTFLSKREDTFPEVFNMGIGGFKQEMGEEEKERYLKKRIEIEIVRRFVDEGETGKEKIYDMRVKFDELMEFRDENNGENPDEQDEDEKMILEIEKQELKKMEEKIAENEDFFSQSNYVPRLLLGEEPEEKFLDQSESDEVEQD